VDPWAPPSAPVEGPSRRPPPGTEGIPWERAPGWPTLLETSRRVLLRPGPLFEGAGDAPPGRAAAFAFVLGLAGGLVASLWSGLVDLARTGSWWGSELLPGLSTRAVELVATAVMPALAPALTASVVHAVLRAFGAARGGAGRTYRAVAYVLGATSALGLIPLIGSTMGGIAALVLLPLALGRIHGVAPGSAVLAVVVATLVAAAGFLVSAGLFVVLAGTP
jgi:hypothetical protein